MKLRLAKYPTLRAEITNTGIVLEYDPIADVAYIELRRGAAATTREESNRIWADYDAKGRLIGVEIFNPRRPDRSTISRLALKNKVPMLARFHPEFLIRCVEGITARAAAA